jgi:hypothetical protein
MESWLEGTAECRRIGLAEYLDGQVTSCASLPGASLCDLCRSMGANRPSIVEDILKQIGSRKTVGSADSAQLSTQPGMAYDDEDNHVFLGDDTSTLQSRKRARKEEMTTESAFLPNAVSAGSSSPFRVPKRRRILPLPKEGQQMRH